MIIIPVLYVAMPNKCKFFVLYLNEEKKGKKVKTRHNNGFFNKQLLPNFANIMKLYIMSSHISITYTYYIDICF